MKKILKIIIIFAIILGVTAIIYSAWIYLVAPQMSNKKPEKGGIAMEEPIFIQPRSLSNQSVFDYWMKNNEIYLVASTGTIYRVSLSGKEERILNQKIENLSSVRPSHDGSRAIISFGYPIKEIFAIFNTIDKSWQPLPTDITAAAWNPHDQNQLAVLRQVNDQAAVSIYNLDTKKFNNLLVLNQQDLKIDWAVPDEIYLTDRPTNKIGGSVWAIHIGKKTIRPIIKDEQGLMIKWFGNGQNGLKFSRKQGTNVLEIIDRNNLVQTILPIVSIPEKCAVGEAGIYCGASESFHAVSLPDDYLKGREFSPDILYQIPAGVEELAISLFDSTIELTPLDIFHPEIKKDRLIFINRLDKNLYLLDLTL